MRRDFNDRAPLGSDDAILTPFQLHGPASTPALISSPETGATRRLKRSLRIGAGRNDLEGISWKECVSGNAFLVPATLLYIRSGYAGMFRISGRDH